MNLIAEGFAWLADPANWVGVDGIPNRLAEHLFYTALVILVSLVIAIPLGLFIGHTGHGRVIVLYATNMVRALPTLGLLILLALIIPGIGLGPPLIALVVLAVPPLLAGAYSGVESVEPAVVDAARAQGMTEWQILTKVEIPLAMPLLFGGLRSSTLQVIATATVAAYIALGGLGRYLIDGLARADYPMVVGGSILVTALALTIEGVLVLVQRASVSPGLRSTPPSRKQRAGKQLRPHVVTSP